MCDGQRRPCPEVLVCWGRPTMGEIHGEFCSVPCSVCQGTAKSKLKDQKLPVLTAEFIGMTVFNEAIYYLYPLGDCHLPGTGNLFQHYHLIILTVMWLSSHQHRLQPHRQCCTEHVLHKGKGSIPSKAQVCGFPTPDNTRFPWDTPS